MVVGSPPFLRALFEENRSAMLFIEPVVGTIVDANLAAANFLGYPREVLRGMPIGQINTNPKRELAAVCAKAVNQAKNGFEFCYRRTSGEIRDVEVVLTPVSFSGKTLLFSIVQDVTQKKLTERKRSTVSHC